MLSTDQYLALLMIIADQQIQLVNLAHERDELRKSLADLNEKEVQEQQEMFAPNGSSAVPSV